MLLFSRSARGSPTRKYDFLIVPTRSADCVSRVKAKGGWCGVGATTSWPLAAISRSWKKVRNNGKIRRQLKRSRFKVVTYLNKKPRGHQCKTAVLSVETIVIRVKREVVQVEKPATKVSYEKLFGRKPSKMTVMNCWKLKQNKIAITKNHSH